MALTARDQQIEDASAFLLKWIRGIDPTYASHIDAARDEYAWSARQMIGAWCAYILENDLYMQVPTNPFFEPGFTGTGGGAATCSMCGTSFTVAYPGQHLCGNTCALQRAAALTQVPVDQESDSVPVEA